MTILLRISDVPIHLLLILEQSVSPEATRSEIDEYICAALPMGTVMVVAADVSLDCMPFSDTISFKRKNLNLIRCISGT